MNDILVLIGMFIAGALFMWLRPKIFKRAKKTIFEKYIENEHKKTSKITTLNASIGNVYNKKGEETFQWKKFTGGFLNVGSLKDWGKDIVSLFNVRKLVIYILIISCVFGYGWWKGTQGQPIKIDIGYGKEARIKLDGHYLHIEKDGTVYVEDKKGNRIKQVAVEDIEGLKRKLSPIGLQLQPIGILAGGLNESGIEGEIGGGISFLRYWNWRLDTYLTQKGIYLGTSYKITDNSGVGLGVGKGWEGDNRVQIYYNWKF